MVHIILWECKMYTFAFANTAFYVMALWRRFRTEPNWLLSCCTIPGSAWTSSLAIPGTGGVVTALYIVDDFGCTPIQDLDEIQDEDVDKSLVVVLHLAACRWRSRSTRSCIAISGGVRYRACSLFRTAKARPLLNPWTRSCPSRTIRETSHRPTTRYAGPLKDFYRGAAVCQCELLRVPHDRSVWCLSFRRLRKGRHDHRPGHAPRQRSHKDLPRTLNSTYK